MVSLLKGYSDIILNAVCIMQTECACVYVHPYIGVHLASLYGCVCCMCTHIKQNNFQTSYFL